MIGRAELVDDPRFRSNAERVDVGDALDEQVAAWFARHDAGEIHALLDEAGVPVCPIYSMADVFADPHFAARQTSSRWRTRGAARSRCQTSSRASRRRPAPSATPAQP